ncbi:MAG: prepilin peptidase [Candidatus Latescibacteria bacterium]|nr:prepilin peptidase [Candidatus Latescibacterota bacterium]
MAVLIIILGLVIGSFLNVCIYRIPRKKSIVAPRSFCPACKKPIQPYDNIPILSYLILGGRCRYCKTKISWQYPFVELLTAGLFLLLFLKFGPTYELLKYIIFILLLIIAAFTDISHRIIPNVISVPGVVLGLILNSKDYINTILAILISAGIFWLFRQLGLWLRKQEMMGWGDIKLAAMIGAFLGVGQGLLALFIGVVAGVLVWTVLMFLKLKSRKDYIPFGTFMVLGSIITIFWGTNIINWYFGLF